jgi:hypothetical protein
MITLNYICSTGCPPKKYSGLIVNNFKAGEVIRLEWLSLNRGKANLDFDILDVSVCSLFTEILTFEFMQVFE